MSIAVGLGLADFPFSDAKAYWRWVALCEDGGVDSIWQTDRLISRRPILECMSTMAALAGATRRIKFGMNVASVGLRDPLLLAKQCATIDMLSEGRLLPAFGIGNVRATRVAGDRHRHQGPRPPHQRRVGTDLAAVDRRVGRLSMATSISTAVPRSHPGRCRKKSRSGSAVPARRRSSAPRVSAPVGWPGSKPQRKPRRPSPPSNEPQRAPSRPIADDHYGASLSRIASAVGPTRPVARTAEAYQARSGRDPRRAIVAGDNDDIMRRIDDYIAAGASKFILRPIGDDDADILAQTRRLIGETLPAVAGLNKAA